MPDVLLAASAPEAAIAVASGVTTELIARLQAIHGLAPTASAAVGRLATAAALLGTGLKGTERISLQILGDGPIGGLSAEAWLLDANAVGVRARAHVPGADLPIDGRGKFDVGGVIGNGTLQVTKTFATGQPYSGVVPLRSGEIAEDVAAYLAFSEQIPSIVALGVLANPRGIVAAGGLIAQVLPGADERAVRALEETAATLHPVTAILHEGGDAQTLLRSVTRDADVRAQREMRVAFACLCNRDRVAAALMSLDPSERAAMAKEDRTEVVCDYCRTPYTFTSEELATLG